MNRKLDILAAIGLALGAIGGLAGSFVGDAALRALCWGVDGAALVMATALLTLKYFRRSQDIVAAGFLVFAVGEGLVLSTAAAALDGPQAVFAGGVALWATALLLISVPNAFPALVRLAGIVAAALFYVVALQILSGTALTPLSQPLPFFAYPVLVLTMAGWIWTLLRGRGDA